MLHKIIWFLGKKSKSFCHWYYRRTKNWLWGIVLFVKESEHFSCKKEEDYFDSVATEWINEQLFKMFKR